MDKIDWGSLDFSYMPTRSHVRHAYRNGRWDEGVLLSEHTINISIAATCLHYGQSVFEGLKAFRSRSGEVRIFRPEMNARRMNHGLSRILGPRMPEELFISAVKRVVRDNLDYVPPYGSGGSLYIRPIVFGSSARMGVAPSDEYEFLVMVVPVGPYYKGGIKPVDALIIEEFDRAAPKGTGDIKLAGNYAASLAPGKLAKENGFDIALYLDPATRSYIEEFGTSNFIAITKDGGYVTPESSSILRSITNVSLTQIAEEMGMRVERRLVAVAELAEFAEVGACGTAVVITPISRVVHGGREYRYGNGECGPVLRELYERVIGIHYGEIEDKLGWMVEV